MCFCKSFHWQDFTHACGSVHWCPPDTALEVWSLELMLELMLNRQHQLRTAHIVIEPVSLLHWMQTHHLKTSDVNGAPFMPNASPTQSVGENVLRKTCRCAYLRVFAIDMEITSFPMTPVGLATRMEQRASRNFWMSAATSSNLTLTDVGERPLYDLLEHPCAAKDFYFSNIVSLKPVAVWSTHAMASSDAYTTPRKVCQLHVRPLNASSHQTVRKMQSSTLFVCLEICRHWGCWGVDDHYKVGIAFAIRFMVY